MTLSRDVVVPGMVDEYAELSAMLRTLSADEWGRPTRCAGWTVGDVAAHVAGTLTAVVTGQFDGLGSPEVTERHVVERRGRTPAELADELDEGGKTGAALLGSFDDDAWNSPAPAGVDGTVGFGVEALWYDTYVHRDDIRAALGMPVDRTGSLRVCVSHIADVLTQQGWPPATLALDGIEEFPVSGGGRRITGDPHDFVLVATGRSAPESLGLDETVNIYRS